MEEKIDIQRQTEHRQCPSDEQIKSWVETALCATKKMGEVSICLMDEKSIAALNKQYRNKPSPTNVLSFPAEIHNAVQSSLLGDIAICAEVVAHEAITQKKNINAHWAHMIIHGILHLLGYDHINKEDAEIMESLEKDILHSLHFSNPYQ